MASSLTGIIDQTLGKFSQARVTLHRLLQRFSSFSTARRPQRMIQGTRGVDDRFQSGHKPYHRCTAEDLVGDRFLPPRSRYFDMSVNWSKYSKPWDVIFDYSKEGIVRFTVRDLPKEIPRDGRVNRVMIISSWPVHVPCPDNYSHCEIRAFHGSTRVTSMGKLAKKEFRTIMSDRGFILSRPLV